MGMTILVGADGSAPAEEAARLGAMLAGAGVVHLLHAVSVTPLGPLSALDTVSTVVSGSPGSLAEEWELSHEEEGIALLERARRQVESAAASAKVEVEQVQGRPSDVILSRQSGFDLIALGSHGHGLLARTFLGSVSMEVLQHAGRPVLFARRAQLRTMLVGVDGSASCLRAAKMAGELARDAGAELVFVHAAEVSLGRYGSNRERVKRAFEMAGQKAFDAAREAAGTAPAKALVVFDEAAHALVEGAKEAEADLVVVGRRGRTPAPQLGLGSVCRRVALHAQTSVLAVP